MLGVVLDQNMTWEPHIAMVVQRCNAITASLYKIRQHFTPEILKLLVQTHVFPHIDYCLSVWGGAAKTHLHRIQKCLNFCARLVTGVRRHEHISPSLELLEWPKVAELVLFHDCMLVHKAITNELCPDSLKSMFTLRGNVSSRVTRAVSAGELELPKTRLTSTQRGFSYRAASAWNKLSPNVRNNSSRSTFANALRLSC